MELRTIEIVLGEEQAELFRLLEETNDNYYISGKAGTGKSVLLQYFVEHTVKRTAVLAPTGLAALNVGGQTIHSFFELDLDVQQPENGQQARVGQKLREILANTDALVIDEVSMVPVDVMDMIDCKLRIARRNDEPFGGMQMLFFGDLYQLAPVVTDGELQRYFDHRYGGSFFFHAPVFSEANLIINELSHVYRQSDPFFIHILDEIRVGNASMDVLESLNARARVPLPENMNFLTLAATNATVDAINASKLAKLEGEIHTYEATISGNFKRGAFPTEKSLKLKVGAQVMLLRNDVLKERRWSNGTLAIVTRLEPDLIYVKVKGVEHAIDKTVWDSYRYRYDPEKRALAKDVVSSFKQFPLRLAWAITIHKSQGQTYSSVVVDLSDGAFAAGQTYVALSRCTSLDTLYLAEPIYPEDVLVSQEVISFMRYA